MLASVVNAARTISRRPAVRPFLKPILPTLRRARRRREYPRFARALEAHQAIVHDRHPQRRVYFDYAMSSVERGRAGVSAVARHRDIAGARMLDVGAAYGGFPIAFRQAGASEAIGVELEGHYLHLAQDLIHDTGCSVTMLHGSATDAAFMASLGTFDIITCTDVIEHVEDPRTLVRNLAAALRPGGLLMLAMPNSRSLGSVIADPHFSWFGVSLLPKAIAKRCYDQLVPNSCYVVEEFYHLPTYLDWLAEAGLKAEVDAEFTTTPEALAAEIDALERMAPTHIHASLDGELREHLRLAVAGYVRDFKVAREAMTLRDLMLEYQVGWWQIVARRV